MTKPCHSLATVAEARRSDWQLTRTQPGRDTARSLRGVDAIVSDIPRLAELPFGDEHHGWAGMTLRAPCRERGIVFLCVCRRRTTRLEDCVKNTCTLRYHCELVSGQRDLLSSRKLMLERRFTEARGWGMYRGEDLKLAPSPMVMVVMISFCACSR